MPEIICRLIRLMGLGPCWNVLSLGAKSEDAEMLEESGNRLFAFVPLSFSQIPQNVSQRSHSSLLNDYEPLVVDIHLVCAHPCDITSTVLMLSFCGKGLHVCLRLFFQSLSLAGKIKHC